MGNNFFPFSIPLYPLFQLTCMGKIRCPVGFAETPDGKNCTDADECKTLFPCLNGGTCRNLDKGQGFYCMCPDGFSGDVCNAQKIEKVMKLSNAALAAILFCLINILSK